MHKLIRTSLAAVTGIAASAALVGSAVAGPPLEQEHFDMTDSHIEQEEHGDEFCPDIPFLVLFEGQAKGYFSIKLRGDGFPYFAFHARFLDTYTNLDTGLSMRFEAAVNDRDLKITDNGDGTITITVQTTGRQKVFDNDGNLLFRDAGALRFEILVDTSGTPGDPSDDVFLEDLGVTKVAGPHDTLDRDFCADLVEFTS